MMIEEVPLYQIIDWTDHFESAKSKTYGKCSYACIPNKHGGVGLAIVQAQPDGAAIYGVWAWIVQLCSRQRTRAGYLTADGKVDGQRLSAAMLSHAFHRPLEEIQRTLQVMTLPQVGWMRVEGKKNTLELGEGGNNGSGTHGATAVGAQDIASSYTENVPDPASSPTDRVEVKERVSDRVSERPPSPQRGFEAVVVGIAEGKARLNALWKRTQHWSFEEDSLLCGICPISETDMALMEKFFGLPKDETVFALKSRSQSCTQLLRNWNQQLDHARGFFGAATKKNGTIEPALWREDLAELHSGCRVPATYAELTQTVRKDLAEFRAKKEKGAT